MNQLQRLGVLGIAFVVSAIIVHERKARAADEAASRGPYAHAITSQVRARGLTFAPTVSAADRQWILAAIAKTRPEAQTLIGEIDGLVTISTESEGGAPWVGMAEQGTDRVTFNTAYLDADRTADRDPAVIHELGHIVNFELVPDDQMERMAAEVPTSGTCVTPETGDCAAPAERFADTFAKWALRGAMSSVGAGYGLTTPSSLEDWGQPLGLLAAKLRLQK